MNLTCDMSDDEQDFTDPEFVLGAVLAQVEDLAVDERITLLEQALQEARRAWYASLPDFPANGRCACGNPGDEFGNWQHIEVGYTRWTNGDHADGFLHLSTDGWDDMSEGGTFEWVECDAYQASNPNCGQAYKVPENMEYD